MAHFENILFVTDFSSYKVYDHYKANGAIMKHFHLTFEQLNERSRSLKKFDVSDLSGNLIGGDIVCLSSGNRSYGLKHILINHHPDYWEGQGYRKNFDEKGQSFFNPIFTISSIINAIASVIQENRTLIYKRLVNNEGNILVTGSYLGNYYKLIIKGREIITLYPIAPEKSSRNLPTPSELELSNNRSLF